MNDALLVRRLERVGDLLRDGKRLVDRKRPSRDTLREIVALHQFHDEGLCAVGFLDAVDARDVRMVERSQHFGFALKTREPVAIGGERGRQDLDRDLALEPGVGRPKHLPHPSFADLRSDFVDAETAARRERQGGLIIWARGTADVDGRRQVPFRRLRPGR